MIVLLRAAQLSFASGGSATLTVAFLLTVWHDAAKFKVWRWIGMTAAVVGLGATGTTGTLDHSTMPPGGRGRITAGQ